MPANADYCSDCPVSPALPPLHMAAFSYPAGTINIPEDIAEPICQWAGWMPA